MPSAFRKIASKVKPLFKRAESLSDIIKKEIRVDKKTRKQLLETKHPLWMPSASSTFKMVGLMGIAWIVSHPTEILNKIILPINGLANNLLYYAQTTRPIKEWMRSLQWPALPLIPNDFDPIAIHAGVGAILVGLIFFVAGSLLDKNEPEKARVLLYKSNLFPLLIVETLAFFFFIGETNWFAVIILVIIAILTLVSFGRVVDVLLHEHKLEEAKKDILLSVTRSAFVKLLDREITKRVWFNCLYKRYENSEILNFSPFGFWGEKKEVVAIKSTKDGYIKELKLKILEKLTSEINRAITDTANNADIAKTAANSSQQKKTPAGYMRKSLNDGVRVGETLLEIKKEVAERIGLKKIERLVLSALNIERDDTEAEARVEIAKLKDRCIAAINEQSTGELEKIIRLYVELINEFFKYLKWYGGGFSSEQARQERGTFFGQQLKPVEWIVRDIREIFERGIDSEDINIIRDVAYLPILLAQEAIENKDHLIFQEFLYFPRMLYEKGFELSTRGNKKAADIIFDRTWRYLKELSAYHLEPKLRDEDYPEQDFKDYSIHILRTFQELLKSAFDKRDFENFGQFLNAFSKLFERLGRHNRYNDNGEEIKTVYDELDEKREEIVFGLASWILSILKQDSDKDTTKRFYQSIQQHLPSRIEELTKVFMRVHSFDTGDRWGWDWWESRPDEGVHTINTLEKLERLFVVKSLALLRSKTETEIQSINLPHNRDLAFLAEGTRDAMKTIDDIEKNPKNWEFVLDEQSAKQGIALRDLLKKAHDQQEQADLQRKRETSISKEMVEKFKTSLLSNYNQSHPLKSILKGLRAYNDKSGKSYTGDIKKMGINMVFDKAPFFGDDVEWHIHTIGLDEAFGFGRSMANGENEHILDVIDKASTIIQGGNFESTLSLIKTSNIIIIATNRAVWNFFDRRSGNYIPKWRGDFPQEFASDEMIEGVYKYKRTYIPVYELYTQDSDQSKIYILDKTKIGKFIQYSPLNEGESKEFRLENFMVNVQPFEQDSDLMKEFLQKPPEWLKKEGAQDKQIEYLRERVLIHVYERYEFQLHKNFLGYSLVVER